MLSKLLKRTAFIALLVAPLAASADPDQKQPTTPTTSTDKADTTKQSAIAQADLDHLAHFRHVNEMEISMGKLAQKQGSTKEVRAYGKMLVTDHTKGLKDATAFAKTNKVTVPAYAPKTEQETQDHQASMQAMDRLKTLKGAEFDREFLTQMAADHVKEIGNLDTAIAAASNEKLKAMLTKHRPAMQKHADQARDLQTKLAGDPSTGTTGTTKTGTTGTTTKTGDTTKSTDKTTTSGTKTGTTGTKDTPAPAPTPKPTTP